MTSAVVYPNPSHGIFSITSSDVIDAVTVTDVLGNVILYTNNNSTAVTLNMSDQANGIYFVKIAIDGQEKTIRIIINQEEVNLICFYTPDKPGLSGV